MRYFWIAVLYLTAFPALAASCPAGATYEPYWGWNKAYAGRTMCTSLDMSKSDCADLGGDYKPDGGNGHTACFTDPNSSSSSSSDSTTPGNGSVRMRRTEPVQDKCQISIDALTGDYPNCDATTIEACRNDRDKIAQYCPGVGRQNAVTWANRQIEKLDNLIARQEAAAQQKSAATPGDQSQANWFVIAGTYEQNQLSKANNRMNLLSATSITPKTIDTGDYANLTPGKLAVVVGPTTKDVALSNLEIVQAVAPDAFIKQGW